MKGMLILTFYESMIFRQGEYMKKALACQVKSQHLANISLTYKAALFYTSATQKQFLGAPGKTWGIQLVAKPVPHVVHRD
jgi:hypothetical protein